MTIQLHVLPPSHPCHAAKAALRLKGLDFEQVVVDINGHGDQIEALYGEGRRTVPGMLVDGEPVHGSRAIFERLDVMVADPPLLPSAEVSDAERWGDAELQDLGRRLPWGALHFRPEAMGVLTGAGPLDPAGTDFAIRFARAAWKYHGITAQRLHDDLQGLPAKLDHVDGLVEQGVVGGDVPNAADLQLGSTLNVLRVVQDLHPLLDDRPCAALTRHFRPQQGGVPAGAYPAGWVPARG